VYIIDVNPIRYIRLSLQVVGASVIMAEITGLRPYTNYTVQVAAVDDRGQEGPLSQPVSVFTPEAGMSYKYIGLFYFDIALRLKFYVHIHYTYMSMSILYMYLECKYVTILIIACICVCICLCSSGSPN
jgi:hypothetical protein